MAPSTPGNDRDIETSSCGQRTRPERCPGQSRRYRLHKATWTVVRESGKSSPRLLSAPAAVAELAKDLTRAHDDDKEHFWVILLNAQNHYLLHSEVSVGSQSATIVHPREVFGPALREGAANLVLIHNHPSGDPTPSREDLRLTRRLVDAGQLLDVRIHDHLIIGNGTETVGVARRTGRPVMTPCAARRRKPCQGPEAGHTLGAALCAGPGSAIILRQAAADTLSRRHIT